MDVISETAKTDSVNEVLGNKITAISLSEREKMWSSVKQEVYEDSLVKSDANPDRILDILTTKLKEQNLYPEEGGSFDYTYEDKMLLFGEKLIQGRNNVIYINRKNEQVTHLWRFTKNEKQKSQNQHQMEVYRDNAGKSTQFQFTREVPGGWIEPEIKHQGDLKDYIKSHGTLTVDQVEQAIFDLKEMQVLTKEAHGDLVKRPDFLEFFQIDQAQKSFDSVEPYGYLNYQNILVSNEGKLMIRDYAGNADPFATGGWKEPDRKDVHSEAYMKNELLFFEEGLRSLLPKEK